MQPRRQSLLQQIAKPTLPLLAQQGRTWLWLNGTCSPTLETDVAAVTGRLNHRWLWRGTDWEFNAPGYRKGPLLAPLDDTIFDAFLSKWAPASAGLIILTFAEDEALFAHLRNLRALTASDGNPVLFNLGMLRQLEELAEGLSAVRFAQLLGPIHSLSWSRPGSSGEKWLHVKSPNSAPVLTEPGAFVLTRQEEIAINLANREWFIRSAASRITQQEPDLAQALGTEELSYRLSIFFEEADGLGLTQERDAYRFLFLRLTYPQRFFVDDTFLQTLLCNRKVAARQRLSECEARLQQLAVSA